MIVSALYKLRVSALGFCRVLASGHRQNSPANPRKNPRAESQVVDGKSIIGDDPGPIAITIKDHAFVPAEVKIPAGAKVELTIRNEQAVPAEFESASLHREKVVSPGSAISVYVGPLQRGRYEFFDDFHPATRVVVVVE